MEDQTTLPKISPEISQNDEALEGMGFAKTPPRLVPREERRKNITRLKKYLPMLQEELLATQKSFDENYPGELDNYTDDERWEFLEEENKTRRAEFFKALFRVELYYTASIEYIKSNGKKDLFVEMNLKYDEQTLREVNTNHS